MAACCIDSRAKAPPRERRAPFPIVYRSMLAAHRSADNLQEAQALHARVCRNEKPADECRRRAGSMRLGSLTFIVHFPDTARFLAAFQATQRERPLLRARSIVGATT